MKIVLGKSEDGREVVDELSLEMDDFVYTNGENGELFSGVAIFYNKERDIPAVIVEIEDGVRNGIYAEWSDYDGFMNMAIYEKGVESLAFNLALENTLSNKKEPEPLEDDDLWGQPEPHSRSSQDFTKTIKSFDADSLLVYDNLAKKILGSQAEVLLENLKKSTAGKPFKESSVIEVSVPPSEKKDTEKIPMVSSDEIKDDLFRAVTAEYLTSPLSKESFEHISEAKFETLLSEEYERKDGSELMEKIEEIVERQHSSMVKRLEDSGIIVDKTPIENMFEKFEYKIGEHWLSALINGDVSGLSDFDAKEFSKWEDSLEHKGGVWEVEEGSSFFGTDEISGLGASVFEVSYFVKTADLEKDNSFDVETTNDKGVSFSFEDTEEVSSRPLTELPTIRR